jgi:purine-binding chemotaxis protein CheW
LNWVNTSGGNRVKQTHTATPDVALEAASVLMFLVADKPFAVDLARVQHILDYQTPTRTPRRPPYVEGIIQHKGRFLPMVSLRKRLGVEVPGPVNPAVLLLVGVGPDPVVGLVVDQVLRVLSLPPDTLLAPPPRIFGIRAEFIRGVVSTGGGPVVWLDERKLLTSAEPISLLA